jgi:hypothetical protein
VSLRDRHAGKVEYASVAAAAPGDARTAWTMDDSERESAPRVPIIGLDAGCIPGTRPGCSARELERAGRDLVRARLSRRRFKPAT